MKPRRNFSIALLAFAACSAIAEARSLRLHAILTDHMVLQRDKPIKIWGWAQPGDTVTVKLGEEKAEAMPRLALKTA